MNDIKTKTYKVGVFKHKRKSGAVYYMAYLRDYNPTWKDCMEFTVEAENGQSAKEKAISMAKMTTGTK